MGVKGLKKQDIIVADPMAHIKLMLWGNYVDTLQLNKTYALNNVRVKFTKYEHYLNTPRNEEMKSTEVMPYTVHLVEYKDEVGMSSTVNGKIPGVQQASKSLCCISYQKRTVNISTTDKAVCQSCNLIQLHTSCKANWVLRILLKPGNSLKSLHLRMDSDAAKTLVQFIDPAIQHESATEDDTIKAYSWAVSHRNFRI